MTDARFLFLFSPNNSGSTALSQYAAGQVDGYLPPFGNNEGQMAPAVKAQMRQKPWSEKSQFDWAFIRAEWERLRDEAGKEIFVEASPPNIVRVDRIVAAFGPEQLYALCVSSPYLYIGSSLYNYGAPPMRPEKLRAAAAGWLRRAGWLVAWRSAFPDMPLITYEAFCADPTALNRALGLPVRPAPDIAGKDTTGVRGVRDMTAGTVSFLSASEIDIINGALEAGRAEMSALGYEIEPGEAIIARALEEPVMAHKGAIRRADWAGRPRRAAKRANAPARPAWRRFLGLS
ncbi:MAG: hypothetical protein AAF360_19565 [Pseudomonadota bacterium]